jgi:peroxiredoxin
MTMKILGVALVIALVGLAGCGRRGEDAADRGAVPKADAPGEGASGIGTAEGSIPPSFALPNLSGNQVTLSDYKGKVVVLDLWATWCPPCRVEIPFLVELYEEHKDAGLVVVGIGLDDGGANVLRPFAEQNGITYPILVGNRDVAQAYKLKGIPTTFILDREGRIAAKHVGFGPGDADIMRAEVARLLGAAGEEA